MKADIILREGKVTFYLYGNPSPERIEAESRILVHRVKQLKEE